MIWATTATPATTRKGKACCPACLKDRLAAHMTPPSAGPSPASDGKFTGEVRSR